MEAPAPSYIVQILLFLLYGGIVRHIWVHREYVSPVYCSLLKWISGGPPPWQSSNGTRALELKTRSDEVRLKIFRLALIAGSHFFFAGMIFESFSLQSTPEGTAHSELVYRSVFTISMFLLCCSASAGTVSLSTVSVDRLYAALHLLLIVRISCMHSKTNMFIFSSQRTIARTLVAILYMDAPKALLWNVCLGLSICLKSRSYTGSVLGEDWQDDWVLSTTIRSELIVCMGVLLSCACTSWICEVCLTAQLDAEDAQKVCLAAQLNAEQAQRSNEHLLRVLCDAVVKVSASGHVLGPTPHFYHLIRAKQNEPAPRMIFREHLGTESEQILFEKAVRTAVGTTALHLNMRRVDGSLVPVQLFITSLPDPYGLPGSLIGIRELSKDVAPMDASDSVSSLPACPPRRKKRSNASASSSSSALSSERRLVFPELDSIEMTFDAASASFSVQRYTISRKQETCDADIFLLKNWLHPSLWERFEMWTQDRLNAEMYGHDAIPDFGPLVIGCPTLSGNTALFVAQSAALEINFGEITENFGSSDAMLDEGDRDSSSESCEGGGGIMATLRLRALKQYSRHGLQGVLRGLTTIQEQCAEV